jgi:hypothetical protein
LLVTMLGLEAAGALEDAGEFCDEIDGRPYW